MATTDNNIEYSHSERANRWTSTRASLVKSYARTWMSLLLILSDTAALLLAFLVATRLHPEYFASLNQYFYQDYLWIPVVLMVAIYATQDLYPAIGVPAVEEVRRLSQSTCLLFLIVIALTFLLKITEIYSRLIFLMTWLIALFLLPVMRILTRRMCARLKLWGEPVAVVGFPDRRVMEVADFFYRLPHKGVIPRAIYLEDTSTVPLNHPYQVHSAKDICDAPIPFELKTILVVVPNWNWVSENVDKYRYSFERVILIQQQRGGSALSNAIAIDFNDVVGFQIRHNLLDPWAMAAKRVIDLTTATICLLVLTPLLAVLGLLIRLDSPGGMFYRQDRLGKSGRTFQLLKFRTMYINGDQIFAEQLQQDKALQEEWKTYQKLKDDPRITRVGGFLRKYSLDELPQLWNILKGQMSLVGPRPMMVAQRKMYGLPFHDYCQVRPGVTGLWQVSGRNHTTFERRAELDMEYIQHWSIWLDIYIIFQTFKEILTRDGAY